MFYMVAQYNQTEQIYIDDSCAFLYKFLNKSCIIVWTYFVSFETLGSLLAITSDLNKFCLLSMRFIMMLKAVKILNITHSFVC